MQSKTIFVIGVILKTDNTISAAEHDRIMATLAADNSPRILRRAEVSRRFQICLRAVDNLPLKKVKLPGRTRSAGFLESDVNALLAKPC